MEARHNDIENIYEEFDDVRDDYEITAYRKKARSNIFEKKCCFRMNQGTQKQEENMSNDVKIVINDDTQSTHVYENDINDDEESYENKLKIEENVKIDKNIQVEKNMQIEENMKTEEKKKIENAMWMDEDMKIEEKLEEDSEAEKSFEVEENFEADKKFEVDDKSDDIDISCEKSEFTLLNHNYLEISNKPHFSEEFNEIISQETSILPTENDRIFENRILQISEEIPELPRTERVKALLRYKHLEDEPRQAIEKLIEKYADCFHLKGEKLGTSTAITHKIFTTNDIPVCAKPYRFPHALKAELDRQIKEMIEGNIIEPSNSDYSSPVFLVPKSPDSAGNKRYRLVVDFRQLNERTIKDRYPLPNILDIIDQVGGAEYYTCLDLAQGFFQVELDVLSRHKTAFATSFGLFQFKKMPMGLSNSPATFQRMMDIIFIGMQNKEIFIFLDDAVIYGKTIEEHNRKFEKFLQRIRDANLKLQPDKCEFLKREVIYLGHLLSKEGVKPDPKKLEAVNAFPQPKNVKNIRQFLGLAGYYRRFIPSFSGIAKPLSNLLKTDAPFVWTEETQKAFDTLKEKLCSQPVLQIVNFDLPFIVTCDASATAIGGILSQGIIGKDRPIGYVSRVLSDTEQRYDTYSREALAIFYTVTQFRPYLLGRKFTVVSDHKPLLWFKNSTDPTSRVSRWRIKLNAYDYDIVYKAGKTNVNADALSRNPVENSILAIQTRTRAGKLPPVNYRDKREKKSNKTQNKNDPKTKLETINEIENNDLFKSSENPAIVENDEGVDSDLAQHVETSLNHRNDTAMLTDSNHINKGTQKNVGEKRHYGKIFVDCKEQLFMRKDNFLYFITSDGTPCDKGAQQLLKRKLLPRIFETSPGEIKVTNVNNKLHFAIALRGQKLESTTEIMNNMTTGFKVLKGLILKENLCSISMAKSDHIENVLWEDVLIKLRTILKGVNVKIIICQGIIRYIEEGDRNKIIQELHDSAIGGHKGVTKTYKRIKQKYYWENMKQDVQNYIRKCLKCQLKKLVRVKTKQYMCVTNTPQSAFEMVSLDIVGPFPVSKNGYTNILTMQCNLSKFCLAIPLKDATTESVADAFIKRFICIFGAPAVILTDQGTNFMSNLMKRVAKKFKIRQIKTTAYHPQSNGSLERSHHSLSEYIKTAIDKEISWDDCLELATFCYNTVPHEGHQFSPFEIIFGRLARLPSSEPPDPEDEPPTYNDYVTKLSTRLHNIQEIARQKLIEAKIKSKIYYDKKANHKEFRIGDSVWLLKGGKQNKLSDQYEGPYTVVDVINNKGNVRIKMKNDKTKVVHANRLRISYIDQSN